MKDIADIAQYIDSDLCTEYCLWIKYTCLDFIDVSPDIVFLATVNAI